MPDGSRIARRIRLWSGLILVPLSTCACARQTAAAAPPAARPVLAEELYVSVPFTAPGLFTDGIEGPACDADGKLYVVNYDHQGAIGRIAPDGTAELFVDLPGGSVGNGIRFASDGAMLVADYARHNLFRIDVATRQVSVLAHEPRMNQPNDLAIDSHDRVFASDPNWGRNSGQLWRVDPDGSTVLLEGDMGTTNGIEVGPNDRQLYVGESAQRRIWVYDLGPDGSIANKRVLIQFPDFGLDGMRCDVDGTLYVTRYGKGTVARVAADGQLLGEVQLLGINPSNIAFGGPDGRTCYVTVADRRQVETFRVERPGRSWWMFQQGRTQVVPTTWARVKSDG